MGTSAWKFLALACWIAVGCTDVRDFRGTWTGPRIGEDAVVRVGFADAVSATLIVEEVDLGAFSGRLTTSDDAFRDATIQPIPGAEADALADIDFAGSPARVFLAFVAASDGGGDALAIVALYDDERIELRLLRGGGQPMYGIFALDRP